MFEQLKCLSIVLCYFGYECGFPLHELWVDVAFDILYVGDTSVIHQTLAERHDLLRKVVKSIKGRLEILVPNGGLNASRSPGKHFIEYHLFLHLAWLTCGIFLVTLLDTRRM